MVIGAKKYLSYQLVDAVSSTIEFTDKLELPPMDEFPTMTERIATSIVEKRKYLETVEMEKITEPEIEPRFRRPRKPYASIFLTAGFQFHPFEGSERPFGPDKKDTLSKNLVCLNFAVSFETQQLLTMLQMGLWRGKFEEKDLDFSLNLNYIMGKGDFAPLAGVGVGITRYRWEKDRREHEVGMSLNAGVGMIGLRTYYFRIITALYGNYTFTEKWGAIPGIKAVFGVTAPTLGPDATVKMHPGCVGAIIGGFFLTGLIIALTS